MAKKPTTKAATPKNTGGRPQSTVPQKARRDYLARFLPAVYEGLARRAEREGANVNDLVNEACASYGDHEPGERPTVVRSALPTGAKVKTSKPDPLKPGARLDKKAMAARKGPKISKSHVEEAL